MSTTPTTHDRARTAIADVLVRDVSIVANVRRAGYRIVPADPQTWETVEPSPRIVACPLCGGHVELEDAAGIDEFAGVVP